MKSILVICLLATSVFAQPKGKPDRVVKQASDLFLQALEADKANDLSTALGLYQKAFATQPHPSTAYNIADIFRREGKLTDAITYYEIYLALSPPAKEAREVEAIIAKLVATPSVMMLESTAPSDPNSVDLASAYIFVNGVMVKKAGEPAAFDPQNNAPRVELSVPSGDAMVDVITPLSHGNVRCKLPPGQRQECTITMEPRKDGLLVISTNDPRRQIDLVVGPKKEAMNTRLKMKPGKQTLMVRDHVNECPAVTIDVPKVDDVLFVFFSVPSTHYLTRCRPVTVKQQRLVFPD